MASAEEEVQGEAEWSVWQDDADVAPHRGLFAKASRPAVSFHAGNSSHGRDRFLLPGIASTATSLVSGNRAGVSIECESSSRNEDTGEAGLSGWSDDEDNKK